MSKILEEAEKIRGLAADLFLRAHKLSDSLQAEELSLEDARESLKAVENTKNFLHDAEHRLGKVSLRLDLCLTYQHENRARLYVIRRRTKDLNSWLTWDEINQSSSTTLAWDQNEFFLLDVAKRTRDRRNSTENDPVRASKVRGFQVGEYTWQIWLYDSNGNSWKLVD